MHYCFREIDLIARPAHCLRGHEDGHERDLPGQLAAAQERLHRSRQQVKHIS
jgi:hypothetical protein